MGTYCDACEQKNVDNNSTVDIKAWSPEDFNLRCIGSLCKKCRKQFGTKFVVLINEFKLKVKE